jgi:Uma2 family endonuclease
MTIEEFDRLEPPEGIEYELVDGELYEVTYPSYVHNLLIKRLDNLLARFQKGEVLQERGFQIPGRPRATKRRADVCLLTPERDRRARIDNDVIGAPDMVVEVLSPSNSFEFVKRVASLCVRNGCAEFWAVSPMECSVTVWRAGTKVITPYQLDDTIPQNALGIGPVAVREIFDGIVQPEPDADIA